LVMVYSIVMTKGRTVNFLFVVAGLMAWFESKQRMHVHSDLPHQQKHTSIKLSGVSIFLLVAPLSMAGWQYLTTGSGTWVPFLNSGIDQVYFGRMSEFLNITGSENPFLFGSLYTSDLAGLVP